jgi:hypothetical protein
MSCGWPFWTTTLIFSDETGRYALIAATASRADRMIAPDQAACPARRLRPHLTKRAAMACYSAMTVVNFENLNGRVARDPWRYVISLWALTSTMDLPVLCLGADNNSIVDFRYTSRPSGPFRLLTFGPRAHGAL